MFMRAFATSQALAKGRGEAAAAKATGELKQLRAAAKAASEQSVETSLMMHSALASLGIDLDKFKYNFAEEDPLQLPEEQLQSLDLEAINVFLLMTDREGSQRKAEMLTLASLGCRKCVKCCNLIWVPRVKNINALLYSTPIVGAWRGDCLHMDSNNLKRAKEAAGFGGP